MKFKNILLLYKKSAYQIYFLEHRDSFNSRGGNLYKKELERFKRTHAEHYRALAIIEQILKSKKIKYNKRVRAQTLDYSKYDFVITVGGDGTFLEAARHLTHQPVLGVNSDPSWSVGRFCMADIMNFSKFTDQMAQGKSKVRELSRIRLKFDHQKSYFNILNDVLICHRNPASMSRYVLTVGGVTEEQKSSGVWVSTAAGSSGGILSAGGKLLPIDSKDFEYKPRELYGSKKKYKLRGGILSQPHTLKIASLMRSGLVFMDGAHAQRNFPFGFSLTIAGSPEPLKVIDV